MRCRNIVVPPVLVARWVRWFAPPVQPFFAGPTGRAGIRAGAVTGAWLSMELQEPGTAHQMEQIIEPAISTIVSLAVQFSLDP